MTRIEGTIGTRLLSIILVDDNETARSALRTLISDYPQVGSVREAANADELFDMLGGTPPPTSSSWKCPCRGWTALKSPSGS